MADDLKNLRCVIRLIEETDANLATLEPDPLGKAAHGLRDKPGSATTVQARLIEPIYRK